MRQDTIFQPFDDYTLANALQIQVQALWYFVLNAHVLYKRHNIPKKSGGQRVLHVPHPGLARAQRKVLTAFLHRVAYPEHVSAYVPGTSTLDAAQVHAGRQILIVVDLKDFFPSTKRSWVRDALGAQFGLSTTASELLATLMTAPWVPGVKKDFVVPQGAPSSGAVANIVAMHRLDPLILEVCARYNMSYTRYADDLAFSTPDAEVPHERVSSFIREIIIAVKKSGYRVNYKKIRAQRPHTQQRLLGMCINVRPNLPKKNYRDLRALVHCCATQGYEAAANRYGYPEIGTLKSYLEGMLTYAGGLTPARVAALRARLVSSGG